MVVFIRDINIAVDIHHCASWKIKFRSGAGCVCASLFTIAGNGCDRVADDFANAVVAAIGHNPVTVLAWCDTIGGIELRACEGAINESRRASSGET